MGEKSLNGHFGFAVALNSPLKNACVVIISISIKVDKTRNFINYALITSKISCVNKYFLVFLKKQL